MEQVNATPISVISSLQGFKGFQMQSRFKLIQYFTATSLVAFGFVAVTLVYFQMRQSDFFKSVQTEEIRSSQETHGKLISNAEQVARRDLLSIHETGEPRKESLLPGAG
jgi:two-component system NtrC family sensor kinase